MPLDRAFQLSEILPHEGRMLLLDELLDAGPEHITCGVTIRHDAMFCEGERGVPSWIGVEYMAQAACAYSGLEEVLEGKRPSIALLLGSRRFKTEVPHFAIGSQLRVHAQLLMRDDADLVAFACTIADGDHVLAHADVKALRPKDLYAIVRGERI